TDTTEETTTPVTVTGTLRRNTDETHRLLTSLAHTHTTRTVDWTTHYTRHTPHPQRIDLPTYPFQRQRFWLTATPGTGDAGAMGLEPAGHPLLGAAVTLAEDDGFLLTGRISLSTHPWLADHTVAGTVLLPGTAFLELALQAGHHTHTPHIEELTLHTPLTLPDDQATVLQITVSPPDHTGHRTLTVSSRPDNPDTDHTWQHHATGTLAPSSTAASPPPAGQSAEPVSGPWRLWPPPDATPVDVGGLYNQLADTGFGYGPAFRGVRRAWRQGDDILAEVNIAPEANTDRDARTQGGFFVHPALLDAALHPLLQRLLESATGFPLPFSWNGVTLHATSATALRVRLTPAGNDAYSITAVTASESLPVVDIESLIVRPTSLDELRAASRGTARAALYEVRWQPLPLAPSAAPAADNWAAIGPTQPAFADFAPTQFYSDISALVRALDAGSPVPDVLILDCPSSSEDTPTTETIHTTTQQTLEFLQEWLAEERLATTRLVITTHGAMACTPGEDVDLAGAAVWGLTRSAQTEEPGRILIIDLDNNHQALW
ncbi:polyketide synthase dehydratase domain-containing protein, partial [Streptomyces stramineus]|uniref:polyketide synthase dehydratase domain-containing protein n=1 Tax=Streptomyces stramineus TaxID=173861 RepID=UPI0031D40D9D